ncbi:MAG: hypothetical protein QHH00_06820 [Methanomassiliicoccales archaeon]|jgi:hypothetical protein|nr:hypothetical protein [Methanomassiliicoccales archaeon]
MWKVLGVETTVVKSADVWKKRMIELSKRRKNREKFVELLESAEVNYWFDAAKEVHAFYIKFPENIGPGDLKFFKEFVEKIRSSLKVPIIEVDGIPQEYRIVLTSEEEEDVYHGRHSDQE